MNFILNQKIIEREDFFADKNVKKRNDLKKIFEYYPKGKILNITRDGLIDSKNIIKYLKKIPKENKLLILDIGGYFVHSVNEIREKFGDRFIGIIEDTENGHLKYLSVKNLGVPVVSVARSPLKSNEDHLVGQSVVFSVDSILREQGILLNNKKVGILGFGKVGNGVLSSLRDKGCSISVYDQDSVTIILASVTSSDDELDLSWLQLNYNKEIVSEYIDRYDKNGHYFYLLNRGNAINFIHGAVVGDFILLVQKEMLDTIIYMNQHKLDNVVHESFDSVRKRVAKLWLNYFLKFKI